MDKETVKNQILKAVYKITGGSLNRNAIIADLHVQFVDSIGKDLFYDLLKELITVNGLLIERRMSVGLTPNGLDLAEKLLNPQPVAMTNVLNVGTAVNSPIQHGINSTMIQTTNYDLKDREKLAELAKIILTHINDLNLPPNDKQKALRHASSLKDIVENGDESEAPIAIELIKSLRNITEGAIGSLLAAGAQPGVWQFVKDIFTIFS